MSDTTKLAQLREPFAPECINELPKGGTVLSYVGHAFVTERLLEVDPEWSWEPFALDERGLPACDYDEHGKPVGLWIRLTVCGVTRPGYGTCEARKVEAMKELIGDALRNAAMRFGVALDLWKKDLPHATDAAPARAQAPTPQARTNGAQNGAQRPQQASDVPACPDCGGAMWDNRDKKTNPKAPDFKCKDKDGCGKGVWSDAKTAAAPAKNGTARITDEQKDEIEQQAVIAFGAVNYRAAVARLTKGHKLSDLTADEAAKLIHDLRALPAFVEVMDELPENPDDDPFAGDV